MRFWYASSVDRMCQRKIKKQTFVYQNDECAKKHRNSKSFVEHDL